MPSHILGPILLLSSLKVNLLSDACCLLINGEYSLDQCARLPSEPSGPGWGVLGRGSSPWSGPAQGLSQCVGHD